MTIDFYKDKINLNQDDNELKQVFIKMIIEAEISNSIKNMNIFQFEYESGFRHKLKSANIINNNNLYFITETREQASLFQKF